nr:proline-rich protein 5-like protein [Callistoctopus minor]
MNCLESTGTLQNSSPLIDPDLFYRYIDLMTNHLGSKISRKRKSLGRIRIQDAVLHIFQRRPLPYSFYTLQSNLRRLIRTDTGPIIYDYFKDQLLKKGMVILRESMKNLKGMFYLFVVKILLQHGQLMCHFSMGCINNKGSALEWTVLIRQFFKIKC